MTGCRFQKSTPFTLGVELEVQLLDTRSQNLSPKAPEILAHCPPHLHCNFKAEFIQSMLEIATPVCPDIASVETQLASLSHTLEELTQHARCHFLSTSLHPFASLTRSPISDGRRYHQLMKELQITGRQMITQGLHVHVGLPDANTAIHVNNAIRHYLPLLLALTASSPFYQGENTGFQSYRTKLFEALPRSGIPETLPSWAYYQRLMRTLKQAGIIHSIREIWWDVRPHPDFGTVEIRICDNPTRLDEIVAIVALIQALVRTLTQRSTPQPTHTLLLSNKWQAARHGLCGHFISRATGRSIPFRQAIRELLQLVNPSVTYFNSHRYLSPIRRILKEGNGANRQLRLHETGKDLKTVVKSIQKEFWL